MKLRRSKDQGQRHLWFLGFRLVNSTNDIDLKSYLHLKAELYRKDKIQEGTEPKIHTALREAESDVNHLESYNLSEHARWIVVVPALLRCC